MIHQTVTTDQFPSQFPSRAPERPFTGRKMLMIMVAFFGVIIAVNVTMLSLALSSFGGLVTPNSYVASQHFETDRAAARAQPIAGWRISVVSAPDQPLRLAVLAGDAPVSGLRLSALAQRPTHGRADQSLHFTEAAGAYAADVALAAGLWDLTLSTADGQRRTVRINLRERAS